MKDKEILYLGMDGVLADFESGIKDIPHYQIYNYNGVDNVPHIFRNLPIMDGALNAVSKLARSGKYELFIATSASWNNISAASDKRAWLGDHFGEIFHKRMFITHRKDLLIDKYLMSLHTNRFNDFVCI